MTRHSEHFVFSPELLIRQEHAVFYLLEFQPQVNTGLGPFPFHEVLNHEHQREQQTAEPIHTRKLKQKWNTFEI